MPMLHSITPTQLMRQIGLPDAPQIFDLRLPEDVAADPYLIPSAQLHPYNAPVPDCARAVLICHRGAKLSQGVAAILRAAGTQAEVLEGGMVAWRAAGLPAMSLAARPVSQLWVTRARPKIDRIACPWLVQRFVDRAARFIFVPAGDVLDVAQRFDAIAFDIEGAPYTHRGDGCTFDTMIADFGLDIPALHRMAQVVRAADTNRHDLAPQAAGLLALSVGLSRQYRDDNHQLAAGFALYDALFRWARDGFDEGHDWPSASNVQV